eukprot:2716854-Rhodomonas_salina.3
MQDLDQLYSHATAINDTFHDMIAEWISYSNAVRSAPLCYLRSAPRPAELSVSLCYLSGHDLSTRCRCDAAPSADVRLRCAV